MQVVKMLEIFKIKGKKAMEIQALVVLIIGVVLAVLIITLYIILRIKGISIIEFVENLFRFGG
jgi:hypothetical protein